MKIDPSDRMQAELQRVIHWSVRALSLLMLFVIVMGVLDVAWTLYERLLTPPRFILTISDMLATFGAFMAVLIAIEIFINITIYLRDNVIHVKIVMATALRAKVWGSSSRSRASTTHRSATRPALIVPFQESAASCHAPAAV